MQSVELINHVNVQTFENFNYLVIFEQLSEQG